jgi:hypothetical protein
MPALRAGSPGLPRRTATWLALSLLSPSWLALLTGCAGVPSTPAARAAPATAPPATAPIAATGRATAQRRIGVVYVYHGGSAESGARSSWEATLQIFVYDPNSAVYRKVIWNPAQWPAILAAGNAPKELAKYAFSYGRIGGRDPAERPLARGGRAAPPAPRGARAANSASTSSSIMRHGSRRTRRTMPIRA